MFCIYLFFASVLCQLNCCYCLQLAEGWEFLNLHCRDNANDPVDWWYIYKPASNTGPWMETGVNFSYITSEAMGRWTPSRSHIFSHSMLQHTMAAIYSKQYKEYIAIVMYEGQEPAGNFKGSASLGLMMANELGGVWIGHTVPGFPDQSADGSAFPPTELKNGHLISCLTLDLDTLNTIAVALKQTEPNILQLDVPKKMKTLLPDWNKLLEPIPETDKISKTSVKKTKILHFVTRDKSLRGMMMARSPGDSRCLYKSFAKAKGLVMDVYGHTEHQNVMCDKRFSIRNIDSISLKLPEQVFYVKNTTDRMSFAVSTAATWQRTGHSKNQYWTCTGNIENQPLVAKGGIVTCVSHFQVWLSFDNFKIKEPECV